MKQFNLPIIKNSSISNGSNHLKSFVKTTLLPCNSKSFFHSTSFLAKRRPKQEKFFMQSTKASAEHAPQKNSLVFNEGSGQISYKGLLLSNEKTRRFLEEPYAIFTPRQAKQEKVLRRLEQERIEKQQKKILSIEKKKQENERKLAFRERRALQLESILLSELEAVIAEIKLSENFAKVKLTKKQKLNFFFFSSFFLLFH